MPQLLLSVPAIKLASQYIPISTLAFGPHLACGFSRNLASLNDCDFWLTLVGMTVKLVCILIATQQNFQDHISTPTIPECHAHVASYNIVSNK